MHQHTPGPWHAKLHPGIEEWIISPGQFYNWGNTYLFSIGFVRDYSVEGGGETSSANARLISAAPELFDALMMALPYFVQFVEMAEQDDSHKPGEAAKMVQHMTLEVMEDAIAKATGETYERT